MLSKEKMVEQIIDLNREITIQTVKLEAVVKEFGNIVISDTVNAYLQLQALIAELNVTGKKTAELMTNIDSSVLQLKRTESLEGAVLHQKLDNPYYEYKVIIYKIKKDVVINIHKHPEGSGWIINKFKHEQGVRKMAREIRVFWMRLKTDKK